MYSSLENFEEFDEASFNFNHYYYEIWENNRLKLSGDCDININCSSKTIDGIETKNVITIENNLNNEISFDKYLSAPNSDLLLLLPKSSENKLIQMMTQISGGPTRVDYDFAINQPYLCYITYREGIDYKISFFVFGENKIIDFYYERP